MGKHPRDRWPGRSYHPALRREGSSDIGTWCKHSHGTRAATYRSHPCLEVAVRNTCTCNPTSFSPALWHPISASHWLNPAGNQRWMGTTRSSGWKAVSTPLPLVIFHSLLSSLAWHRFQDGSSTEWKKPFWSSPIGTTAHVYVSQMRDKLRCNKLLSLYFTSAHVNWLD